MSRQGGGYFGTRPFAVPGCLLGRAAGCARGRRPAREPSAPRASLGASSRSPARPRHRPPAPRPRRGTPWTPPPLPASLHERNTAPARHPTAWLTFSVKDKSPLLAQNGQNTAPFGVLGRRIFHGTPLPVTQGRLFFHPGPVPTPQAGQNSPSLPPSAPRRDKIRPARSKHPKIGRFR